jgi:hypothetical protein
MRPETYVDLIRVAQLLRAPGGLFEQRPKVCRFFRIQICDVKAVAARLDEERADPARPDSVLDDPMSTNVNMAARKILEAVRQVTGETARSHLAPTTRSFAMNTDSLLEAPTTRSREADGERLLGR